MLQFGLQTGAQEFFRRVLRLMTAIAFWLLFSHNTIESPLASWKAPFEWGSFHPDQEVPTGMGVHPETEQLAVFEGLETGMETTEVAPEELTNPRDVFGF